jgi:hypothetical protein
MADSGEPPPRYHIGLLLLVLFVLAAAASIGGGMVFGGPGQQIWPGVLATVLPMVLFLVLAIVIFRGAIGSYLRALPSPERRAAGKSSRQPPAVTIPGPMLGGIPAGSWPTVPRLDASSGEVLPFRLQPEAIAPGCTAGCLAVFAVFWLCMTVPLLVSVIHAIRQGHPHWGIAVCVAPFTLVGVGLLVGVVVTFRTALALVLGGSVSVEVSEHPLAAGSRCEVCALFSRPEAFRELRLALVCVESATYQQGTSTATAHRTVHDEELTMADTLPRVASGTSIRGALDLPPTLMHSFESPRNKVTWKIEVRGKVGSLPYRRAFPLILYPTGWRA